MGPVQGLITLRISGLVPYAAGLQLQALAEAAVGRGALPGALLLLQARPAPRAASTPIGPTRCPRCLRRAQHNHVFTVGKRATLHNVLASPEARPQPEPKPRPRDAATAADVAAPRLRSLRRLGLRWPLPAAVAT